MHDFKQTHSFPKNEQAKTMNLVFDKYIIQEELGRGGMGVVYKALDTKLQRYVSLKFLSNIKESSIKMFLREAQAMAQLEHENIVKIYEVIDSPKVYFAMELIEGKTLESLIYERKLKVAETVKIFEKITEALSFVHGKGLIHRDIKPSNVMITNTGIIKLMDFGLTCDDAKKTLTESMDSDRLAGTPLYMSPEQFRGKFSVRSDIYSVGAMLYECLTGRAPYQATSVFSLVQKLMEEEIINPRTFNSHVNIYLEAICLKCLKKSPKKRYVSAKQLNRDFHNFLLNRPIIAKPYGFLDKSKNAILHNKIFFSGIVLGILFSVILLFSYLGLQKEKEKTEKANLELQKEKEKTEKANLKLQKEKETLDILSDYIFASLLYAYNKHHDLQNDQKFLEPIRKIFEQLESTNITEKHIFLKGIVLGYSNNAHEQQQGLDAYNKIIKQKPHSAIAYSLRASLYWNMKKYEEALADYSKSILLEENPETYYSRASLYHEIKKYTEALSDYNKVILLNPENPKTYNNRANLYWTTNEHKKAFTDYNKAISLDPAYAKAYLNRGGLYHTIKKYSEALIDYNKAISLSPAEAAIYERRGFLYYELQEYDNAASDWEKAIELNPNYASNLQPFINEIKQKK